MCLASMLYSVGVRNREPGKLLKDLDDPELRNLADALPSTILHSRTDSTSKKYLSAFKRWKGWAMEHGMVVFPAQAHQVASPACWCGYQL